MSIIVLTKYLCMKCFFYYFCDKYTHSTVLKQNKFEKKSYKSRYSIVARIIIL